MKRWIKIALRKCKDSSHPNHKMCALVVKGGSLLSAAANSYRWKGHAELRAIRPHLNVRGSTIYIVRANSRMSKPCHVCMKAIKESGIDTVVYFGANSEIHKEKVINEAG